MPHLAGPMSAAEAGARACATMTASDREVKEFLDPIDRHMQHGEAVDPGQGDRLDPDEQKRRTETIHTRA